MDGVDRVGVFLVAPGELPVRAADGPGPETDGGELKVGVAELFKGAKLGVGLSAHAGLDARWHPREHG